MISNQLILFIFNWFPIPTDWFHNTWVFTIIMMIVRWFLSIKRLKGFLYIVHIRIIKDLRQRLIFKFCLKTLRLPHWSFSPFHKLLYFLINSSVMKSFSFYLLNNKALQWQITIDLMHTKLIWLRGICHLLDVFLCKLTNLVNSFYFFHNLIILFHIKIALSFLRT